MIEKDFTPTRSFALKVFVVALAAVAGLWGAGRDLPVISPVLRVLLVTGLAALLLWALSLALRALLWRVGRRLAFSYLLIGVLPIPMLALLGLLTLNLLASLFLGHVLRTQAADLQARLETGAERALERWVEGRLEEPQEGDDPRLRLAYYQGGQRVAGDDGLPAAWPAWLEVAPETARQPAGALRLVALEDGAPALVGLATGKEATGQENGVVAVYRQDPAGLLSEACDAWVRLASGEFGLGETMDLVFFGRSLSLRLPAKGQGLGGGDAPEAERAFFAARSEGSSWRDHWRLSWTELSGPLRALASGAEVSPRAGAVVVAMPRSILKRLLSTSSETRLGAWAVLFLTASLLSTLYFVAVLVAIFMIYSLSRAVNQLSRATEAVRGGDFAYRLPVRRRDQVGQLQRSFNEMAANLQSLVARSARQELMEKELQLARDVQRSLIPANLPHARGLEFVSVFQPSAAIGGDYFDVLPLGSAGGDPDRRLVVAIADVAGHGLSAGLRMAMVKAALQVLCGETCDAGEILRRLDALLRGGGQDRFFVTATLGLLDPRRGTLELTNAGHPPTYLLRASPRDGAAPVEEILLPSSPLGGLGRNYTHHSLQLEPGDAVVWLSDGLLEATDADDEPFGYQRIREALERAGPHPDAIRQRLLTAVDHHTGGRPADDDRTLVVLLWRGAE